MPRSYKAGKHVAAVWVNKHFDDARIIDVGAGQGTYADLLGHGRLDGIEIFESYVDQFGLRKKYSQLFIQDARDFDRWDQYELAIFGDVIEHMTPLDAARILTEINNALVAVPYQFEQGAVGGNEAERHLQPDLTPAIFRRRFPEFRQLWSNRNYGYWVKTHS